MSCFIRQSSIVTRAAWASNTVERLRGWGFNALGAGCDNADLKGFGLGRTVFLALGDSATSDDEDDHEHYLVKNLHTPGTAFPNVFNPDFAEQCDRAAAKACAANRDDPEVLGSIMLTADADNLETARMEIGVQ